MTQVKREHPVCISILLESSDHSVPSEVFAFAWFHIIKINFEMLREGYLDIGLLFAVVLRFTTVWMSL